nr:type IV pilus modification protein PilV [Schlegelella koreensis]
MNRRAEGGFFLIEALVAILIFALGILGLVAMGGTAVSAQSDAQYRTEASAYADAIASRIALSVDRSSDAALAASLPRFAHRATGAPADCAFTGDDTEEAALLDVINRAASAGGGLPGADATFQQVAVDTAQRNRVSITVCWRTANDSAPRRHTLVTYVN